MVIFAREKKKKLHVKNIKFCAREKWFSSREKNEKTAREKNKMALKNLKMGQKVGVKKENCPSKK